MSQVRIISDGTPKDTKVLVDGAELDHVLNVSWTVDANQYASARIQIAEVEADVLTDFPLINEVKMP